MYLWPDADPVDPKTGRIPGKDHMDKLARNGQQVAGFCWPFVVRWPGAPPHGDAADFEGDAGAVWELLANAVLWEETAAAPVTDELGLFS